MLKVAVLDDYQNVFNQIVNVEDYKSKYEFTIFNDPFQNELETIEALNGFEALFIMRERTKITKTLISNLPKLKFIMTSGTRNKAIDFIKNLIASENSFKFASVPLHVLEFPLKYTFVLVNFSNSFKF